MTKNTDFRSVEFFRKVRDKHASLLSGKQKEEIIAFFCGQKAPNNRINPTPNRASSSGV